MENLWISYTIAQALRWNKAKHVIVSTDSEEIKKISEEYGAKAPFLRPSELATDGAAKLPVIRHALLESEELFGEEYDIVVDLDPTAPIRTTSDLDHCLNLFIENQWHHLFSVVSAHKNPYFNMVEENEAGEVRICKRPKKKLVRRQDAPKVYNVNASIYLYSRKYLLEEKYKSNELGEEAGVYVMDELSSTDIDREIDFKFIEFLIKEGIVDL